MKSLFFCFLIASTTLQVDLVASQAPTVVHAIGSFGENLGMSGMVVSNAPGLDEVFISAYHDGPFNGDYTGGYWQAFGFDSALGSYAQSFLSPIHAEKIVGMGLLNVDISPGDELVIGYENGEIRIHHQVTRELLQVRQLGMAPVDAFAFANLDGVGFGEIILLRSNGAYVYNTFGTLLDQYAAMRGYEIVVGQMDADPGLELASTNGTVVDFATGLVQCQYIAGFGRDLDLLDFDSDGMQELIFSEYSGNVRAFDVDTCTVQWSFAAGYVNSICVGDSDQDGLEEIIIGEDGGFYPVYGLDPVTQQVKWSHYSSPSGNGAEALTTLDLDNDGIMEVLWTTGGLSTAADTLVVMNGANQLIEWESLSLRGPFAPPALGDVDGDGVDEIVSISFNSGPHEAARIIVMEQGSHQVYYSDEVLRGSGTQGARDIKLFDFNGDGDMEILLGGNYNYSALMEIYDFQAGGNFTLAWDNNSLPGVTSFHSVDACDLDGDGTWEIIGGAGNTGSGAPGTFVYAYDLATGNQKWHSIHLGGYWDDISTLLHGDFDADGQLEIAAQLDGGYIYILGQDLNLEAVIPGDFVSLSLLPVSGGSTPQLLAGTETGEVQAFQWSGSQYAMTRELGLLGSRLDGVTLPASLVPRLFASSAGQLHLFQQGSTSPIWQSEQYGDFFGRKVLELINGDIATTGSNGLFVIGLR